jgi:hypothetical protein
MYEEPNWIKTQFLLIPYTLKFQLFNLSTLRLETSMYFFTHFGLHWHHFNWSLIHEALATIQALVKDDQNFEILIRKKCQSLSNMIMSRMWPDQKHQIHRCEALLKPDALSPWLGIVFEQLRNVLPMYIAMNGQRRKSWVHRSVLYLPQNA